MGFFDFLKSDTKKDDLVWKDKNGNEITDKSKINDFNDKFGNEPDYIITHDKIIENNIDDKIELDNLLDKEFIRENENNKYLEEQYIESLMDEYENDIVNKRN